MSPRPSRPTSRHVQPARRWQRLACAALVLLASRAWAQSERRPAYDIEFIGAPLADPVMQHNKESYVSYGCAYCHGVNLVPRGEAPDLRESPVVAADTDGSLIAALLKRGVPETTKLSPMPQYSDLSERQLHAIADWIHDARQRDRHARLTQGPLPAGDAGAGQTAFQQSCRTCHTAPRTLAAALAPLDATARRARILQPAALAADHGSFALDRMADTARREGQRAHGRFVERTTPTELAGLLAFLDTQR